MIINANADLSRFSYTVRLWIRVMKISQKMTHRHRMIVNPRLLEWRDRDMPEMTIQWMCIWFTSLVLSMRGCMPSVKPDALHALHPPQHWPRYTHSYPLRIMANKHSRRGANAGSPEYCSWGLPTESGDRLLKTVLRGLSPLSVGRLASSWGRQREQPHRDSCRNKARHRVVLFCFYMNIWYWMNILVSWRTQKHQLI